MTCSARSKAHMVSDFAAIEFRIVRSPVSGLRTFRQPECYIPLNGIAFVFARLRVLCVTIIALL
jgi:hypothetical protein